MRVLVVVAHPDDEVLGCGGSIARYVSEGHEVFVLFMSEGVSSRGELSMINSWDSKVRERELYAVNASRVLGFQIVGFLRHPNLRMTGIPMLDLAKQVEKTISEVEPDTIYTHHFGDMNSDHRITFEAVMTACRPKPDFSVKRIYTFEIPSSTEWGHAAGLPIFSPSRYVDISMFLSMKMEALRCYAEEIRPPPHPRSTDGVQALARLRGFSVCLPFAEAFSTVRDLY